MNFEHSEFVDDIIALQSFNIDEDDESEEVETVLTHVVERDPLIFMNGVSYRHRMALQGHRSNSVATREKEIKHVLRKTKQQCDIMNDADQLTVDSVVELYFGRRSNWLFSMEDRVREGLRNIDAEQIFQGEIFGYLEFLLMCHFYDTSPTKLFQRGDLYRVPEMKLQRFLEIQAALGTSDVRNEEELHYWNNNHNAIPLVNVSLQHLAYLSHEVGFVPDSVVAVDDHKLTMRSRKVYEEAGLTMCFHRDSNPGPNLMAALSCGTGLFLGGKFQAIGESAIACAEKALSGDNNGRWFYHIFLNPFCNFENRYFLFKSN